MIGPREQLDVGLPGDSQTNGMTTNRMHCEPATAIKRESTGREPGAHAPISRTQNALWTFWTTRLERIVDA
jgi:hypothetical protein